MRERIQHMLVKEFIQIFRDPRMKTVLFVMPVVQVLLFGYVVTLDVKQIPTAIYDLDSSVASRELLARFTSSGYFAVAASVGHDARRRELLDRGQVQAILRMNQGFEEDLRAGRT